MLPANPPTLDNFVPGGNGEALTGFTAWLAGGAAQFSLCLWGEAGAGKSHLLAASGFLTIDAALDPAFSAAPETGEIAVDHVDRLNPEGQIALFNSFNRLKANGGR
ncbi:MAG TPA: DnaA regulatory inactivator Hda, partial [Rhodocyclaceae bacterium]|nr:DnaA regulatory inactivator Hda [Rhodocyclaceae bacterium]